MCKICSGTIGIVSRTLCETGTMGRTDLLSPRCSSTIAETSQQNSGTSIRTTWQNILHLCNKQEFHTLWSVWCKIVNTIQMLFNFIRGLASKIGSSRGMAAKICLVSTRVTFCPPLRFTFHIVFGCLNALPMVWVNQWACQMHFCNINKWQQ